MIKISKEEKEWLVSKGVKFGENGISHTYNKNKHYYLCENRPNMSLHRKFWNDKIVR